MNDITDVAIKVKETEFLNELLKEFVERGLGSLPGRETTITLVGLLLKHHPDWKNNPPEDYEIARLLRTSPRKIRNIRDEIGYRDSSLDDVWCKERLVDILKTAERVSDGTLVSFQIDDGLVRDYTQKLVRENYGIIESGFNTSIIKISGRSFAALVLAVMPEDKQQELIGTIPEEIREKSQDDRQPKTPIRLFMDSFAKEAGKEAGKKATKLAFSVLTCGFSDISDAVKVIKGVLKE
ncbi:MAG: hypothetical protein OXI88_16420 [Gammaproteobacteria bacterium]|nr:hypothetical protein [Gammaproteobacteria bacterium]